MPWDLEKAMTDYGKQGAPSDQSALVSLLREVQREMGGSIPPSAVGRIAEHYRVKESWILAIIKRLPGFRLGDGHLLEICAGSNCAKHRDLAALAERISREDPHITVKTVPCLRMCGKGPNIKWDGKLHHQADEALLLRLAGRK